jgi:hypothetical protein
VLNVSECKIKPGTLATTTVIMAFALPPSHNNRSIHRLTLGHANLSDTKETLDLKMENVLLNGFENAEPGDVPHKLP